MTLPRGARCPSSIAPQHHARAVSGPGQPPLALGERGTAVGESADGDDVWRNAVHTGAGRAGLGAGGAQARQVMGPGDVLRRGGEPRGTPRHRGGPRLRDTCGPAAPLRGAGGPGGSVPRPEPGPRREEIDGGVSQAYVFIYFVFFIQRTSTCTRVRWTRQQHQQQQQSTKRQNQHEKETYRTCEKTGEQVIR